MPFSRPIPKSLNALTLARNKYLAQAIGVRSGRDFDFNAINRGKEEEVSGRPGKLMQISGTYDLIGLVQGSFSFCFRKDTDGRWLPVDGELVYETHWSGAPVERETLSLGWAGDFVLTARTQKTTRTPEEKWEYTGFNYRERSVRRIA